MKRTVFGLLAFLMMSPIASNAEDVAAREREDWRAAKKDAALDVLSIYGGDTDTGPWAASVFVSRNGGGLNRGDQLHTDNSAIIQGFADRENCVVAGRLVALQMMHVHGETVNFSALGRYNEGSVYQNKMEHSEGTVLCLNVATGEMANETVSDPS